MKTTPANFSASLIKTHGAQEALRIARDSYQATRTPGLAEYEESKDHRVQSARMRSKGKLANFWDHVFGITLKKAIPEVTRKQYLANPGLQRKA